jgi:DNA-binding transcriptional LysR family regulator
MLRSVFRTQVIIGIMHFDLSDLRLLVHTAEAGSLTRGAQSAHLSPAAASARLKALEDQVGGRLFYRDNRGVTVTPLGERLLRHARIILRQVEYARSEVAEFAGEEAGHIRIFAHHTAATEFMPQVLASFMAKRPRVTIDLQERQTRDVLRGVLDGTTDLGLVPGPIPPAEYQAIPLSSDRLVLVTPLDHPLANRRAVAFAETLGHQHVGLHEASSHTEFLREVISAEGLPLTLRIQLRSFDAMCRMIEAGVGIGVMPEGPAKRYQKNSKVKLVKLSDAWAVRQRSILVRDLDALPGCGRALIEHVLRTQR